MADDQSPTELAYALAQERIAKARAENATTLNLSGSDSNELRALDKLPPEIAELTHLQSLMLDDTKVTDLAPLSDMTALRTLGLGNTQVTDLAPLQDMTALQSLMLSGTRVEELSILTRFQKLDGVGTILSAEWSFPAGLWIDNTPATSADPTLARLADVENDAERTQAILSYLRGETAPDQPTPPVPAAPPARPVSQSSLARAAILLATPHTTAAEAYRLHGEIKAETDAYLNTHRLNTLPDALKGYALVQAALDRLASGARDASEDATARAIDELQAALDELAARYVDLEKQLQDAETRAALAEDLRKEAEARANRTDYLTDRAATKHLIAEREAGRLAKRDALRARIADENIALVYWAARFGLVAGTAYIFGATPAALAAALEPIIALTTAKK